MSVLTVPVGQASPQDFNSLDGLDGLDSDSTPDHRECLLPHVGVGILYASENGLERSSARWNSIKAMKMFDYLNHNQHMSTDLYYRLPR